MLNYRKLTRKFKFAFMLILTISSVLFVLSLMDQSESFNNGQTNKNFYKTLTLRTEDRSANFVLLVTYARSGSSWLGEITSRANSTFYVFEPLQKIIPQGYFVENQVCFNNNTCREPRHLLERHTIALTALYRLFTCQLSKLHPFFKETFETNLRSEKPKTILDRCLNSSNLDRCLKEMEHVCAEATHRIIKTIRLPMALVNGLIAQWPNLKVIHLIRDPRAITHSRRLANEFSMSRNLLTHSMDLCSRMHKDLVINMQIQKEYPNRLQTVFYEALAEKPLDGAKYIYQFLKMPFTKEISLWINHTAHVNRTRSRDYYRTVRTDSEKVANKWRIRLDIVKVQAIDYMCKELYSVTGYIPMNSSKELRSLEIPSRHRTDIDGFV